MTPDVWSTTKAAVEDPVETTAVSIEYLSVAMLYLLHASPVVFRLNTDVPADAEPLIDTDGAKLPLKRGEIFVICTFTGTVDEPGVLPVSVTFTVRATLSLFVPL
jgi:hypothetical protein